MEYLDFRITMTGSDQEGKHTVLIESPAGGFTGEFVNPFAKADLDKKLIQGRLQVRSLDETRSEEALQDIGPIDSTNDLEEIGNELSRALFQDQVMSAYAESKGIVSGSGEGLRIRIRIDPGMEEYAELMSLPWEFLYDEAANVRIELVPHRAIVRDPITPTPRDVLTMTRPLRVLVAISDPQDYPPLKLGREMLSLSKVAEIPGIEVKFLEKATIRRLNDEMGQKEYHVFHFMGHGGIVNEKTVLVFKGEDDNGYPIDGEGLRLALSDSIRLVFLNACETARIPEADPFASIPTELGKGGIPAIVAMQFPISDSAAIRFCVKFYSSIATGLPVDQAMGEARKEIFFGVDTRPEWGTPVLFMNSPDGTLFDIEEEPQSEPT